MADIINQKYDLRSKKITMTFITRLCELFIFYFFSVYCLIKINLKTNKFKIKLLPTLG